MIWRLLILTTVPVIHVNCQTQSNYDYYGSGGWFCTNETCLNDGICGADLRCVCSEGYSGQDCGIPPERVIQYGVWKLQVLFSVITTRAPFENATEECLNQLGRVLSNASSPDKQSAFGGMFLDMAEDRRVSLIQNEWFWVIAGDFEAFDRNETNCTAMNITGHIQTYPCSSKLLPVCETPISGFCYPEVAKRCPPTAICRIYLMEGGGITATCHCRMGLEINSTIGICEDVDECMGQRVDDCYSPTICQNTFGSYRCGCSDGRQGNGNDSCAYILTMEQRNIDFTKILLRPKRQSNSTRSMQRSQWASLQLVEKLTSLFSKVTKSVENVVLKSLNVTNYSNASAIYDVHVGDPSISTTSLKELYQEADRQNETGWLKGSTVIAAPLFCMESKFRLGQDLASNFYTFPAAQPGTTVGSKEECYPGRNRATVECWVKQGSDGRYTAYFEYRTMVAVPCEQSVSFAASQFLAYKSPETAEAAMSQIDSLTANYTDVNTNLIRQAIGCMQEVARYVWNSNVKMTVATMRSMMNVANNIYNGEKYRQRTGIDSELTDALRRDIVQALQMCSTNLDIEPSQQVTMETDTIVLQVSDVYSANSSEIAFPQGIFFEAVTLKQSICPVRNPRTTQAAINHDVITKAGDRQHKTNGNAEDLQVSIMFFTDSEFFPSDSYDFELEQVLSLRISKLELDNLQPPIWFQIPPKQREENVEQPEISYYKCAYLEEETGIWLSDGCRMIPGSNPPNCSCDHMTNFAVLVQVHPQLGSYALEVFGKIFCSISIIGLFLTLFIHLYFPSLRSSQVMKIHCHLALCLLLTYIILLTSTERPRAHDACIVTAVFLHFFLLSSWGWMLAECVTMYKKLVAVFSKDFSYYVTKAAVLVYCLAAVITLLTVLIAVAWYDKKNFDGWSNPETDFVPSIYISDRLCWLQSYPLIIGFLIPIGIMFLVNLIGSIFIMRAITWGRKKVTSTAKDRNNFKAYFIRTVTISVLLGLCWVFAIPLTLSDDPTVNAVFGWLFTITNALQGFLIFMFSCVARADVRKLWLTEIKKFFKGRSEQAESKVSTVDTGGDTREMLTTTSHQESSRKTEKTNLDVTNGVKETDESDKISSDHFQMGEVSSFHPKRIQVSSEDAKDVQQC